MHKKTTDKLNAGNGMFLPFAFFAVILHIEGNGIFVHTNDAMAAVD